MTSFFMFGVNTLGMMKVGYCRLETYLIPGETLTGEGGMRFTLALDMRQT